MNEPPTREQLLAVLFALLDAGETYGGGGSDYAMGFYSNGGWSASKEGDRYRLRWEWFIGRTGAEKGDKLLSREALAGYLQGSSPAFLSVEAELTELYKRKQQNG